LRSFFLSLFLNHQFALGFICFCAPIDDFIVIGGPNVVNDLTPL
jgi:hypothetical protein